MHVFRIYSANYGFNRLFSPNLVWSILDIVYEHTLVEKRPLVPSKCPSAEPNRDQWGALVPVRFAQCDPTSWSLSGSGLWSRFVLKTGTKGSAAGRGRPCQASEPFSSGLYYKPGPKAHPLDPVCNTNRDKVPNLVI